MAQTPVYFFSHGGPPLMYDTPHPAYAQLQKVGREITGVIKPKAVVVVSAHWEAEEWAGGRDEGVEIGIAEEGELLYDFYGFPARYYHEKYPYKVTKGLASLVGSTLEKGGIKVKSVARGVDHGVWVCFKVAFDPSTNPLSIPLIQISLPPATRTSPTPYFNLGAALAPLRSAGVLLIMSGMTAHNLSSLRQTRADPTPLPYTLSFSAALEDAIAKPISLGEGEEGQGGNGGNEGIYGEKEVREEAMAALLTREDSRLAHPTLEHLWPVFVGVGAARGEKGRKIWGMGQGGIGWGIYRWGEESG